MKLKLKKSWIGIGVACLVVLVVAGYFFFNQEEEVGDYLNPQGILKSPSIDQFRYNFDRTIENTTLLVREVSYEGAGTVVSSLLVQPTEEGLYPGILFIPGAGVDKFSVLPLVKRISEMGYVVLTIDQRGTGDTAGHIASIQEDFANYQAGGIATSHLRIIDAIIGVGIISTLPAVNQQPLLIVGESLGGAVGIMAAAVEPNVDGYIGISTSGLHFAGTEDPALTRFVRSIDPDSYVSLISPRPLIMIHNTQDTNIEITSAALTYDKALQPKNFAVVNDTTCNHGYCPSMFGLLNQSLQALTS